MIGQSYFALKHLVSDSSRVVGRILKHGGPGILAWYLLQEAFLADYFGKPAENRGFLRPG